MLPRLLLLLLFQVIHQVSSGQGDFQGSITYRSGDTGFLALKATCYFAPGKVRLEVNYPVFPGDEYAYSPYELFDQEKNTVYIAEPRSRLLQKIILDTPWISTEVSARLLKEKKILLGYTCYGMETISLAPGGKKGEKPFQIRHTGWYAEKLPTSFSSPYPLALYGITDRGHICLLMESTLITEKDSSNKEIEFVAVDIQHKSPDEALFVLPEGFDLIEFSAKDLLRKKL